MASLHGAAAIPHGPPPPRPRRIEAAAGAPGGWLLDGGRIAVATGDVWGVIRQSLQADPAAPCIRCAATTMTRRQVLDAVDGLPWERPYRRVGLHVPRSLASVLLTLAVWRNGGVYVPIAVEYPLAGVVGIAAACDLDMVVADRRLDLPGYPRLRTIACAGQTLFLHARDDPAGPDPTGPDPAGDNRDICYIAHTSGSTGAPKGVMVSHANLLNRLACMRGFLELTPADRLLYKTSAVFDVHVWEFTLPLAGGCLLVIYPQTRHFDLFEVARLIALEGVSVVGFVPALLRLLLDNAGFVAGNRLRAVLCGGEAWGVPLAREFHARLPGCRLFNSYGPTETTIAVANWPVPADAALEQIRLGGPLPNTVFLIEDTVPDAADADGRIVGPLAIGGAQVALGYIDERGRDRFFERAIDGETVRFYRTGDLVRLDPANGALHFKGRQDRQVKVNGTRIELEEIEEAVCAVDGVEGCVAFLVSNGLTSQLCAVYKTRRNLPMPPAEIKAGCARLLPAPLLPTRLQQVAEFPLGANGKIDRASLIAGFVSVQQDRRARP